MCYICIAKMVFSQAGRGFMLNEPGPYMSKELFLHVQYKYNHIYYM